MSDSSSEEEKKSICEEGKEEKEKKEKKSRKKLTEEDKAKKFGKDYQKEYYEKRKEKKKEENKKTIIDVLTNTLEEIKKCEENKRKYSIVPEIENELNILLERSKMYETVNNMKVGGEVGKKMLDVVSKEIYEKNNMYIKNVEKVMSKLRKSREKQKINTEIYALLCSSKKIYFCIMEKQEDILSTYKKTYATMLNYPEKILGKFKGEDKDLKMIVSYFKMKYEGKIESEEKYETEMTMEEIEEKMGFE
jgi:hypothetical protein